jgi:MOSC domain-containing protein YiiM
MDPKKTGSSNARVKSVSCDAQHCFSKTRRDSIKLVAGLGVEGDAHSGVLVQHRYTAGRTALLPNLRQVHLMETELFEALATEGFDVFAGDLGENVTTQGVNLLTLPLHTRLHLGAEAIVIVTGLRTPCGHIDRFRKGLKRRLILRHPEGPRFRAGVMGTVARGGIVYAGDTVQVRLPRRPWLPLPELP